MKLARIISGIVIGSSLCIAAITSADANAAQRDHRENYQHTRYNEPRDQHRHDRHRDRHRQQIYQQHRWLHEHGIPHDYLFGYSRHEGHPHKSWRKAHRYWARHDYRGHRRHAHEYDRHHDYRYPRPARARPW